MKMTYYVQSKTFFQFVPDVVHIWHKIHAIERKIALECYVGVIFGKKNGCGMDI